MPWRIWSPEDFPKRNDQGWLEDYAIAFRIQIPLYANTWTDLDENGFYTTSYSSCWVDKEADEKEVTISAKDLAVRICRDRGGDFEGLHFPVGLMYCNSDRETPESMQKLEEVGRARNLAYRKKRIEAFEQQFREKSQTGKGRWTPTTYELECYKIHGIKPPEVVNRPAEQAVPVVHVVQPSPELIAQLVAAEMAKQRAAETPPRKI